MPGINPNRILKKFEKLHRKYKGNDREVFFVKYVNTSKGFYKNPDRDDDIITPIVPPPIIQDKPDEDIAASFGGGIEPDQKLFTVVPTSFVVKLPLDTLSDRAEQFLFERTGQQKGCIRYGNLDYILERILVGLTIGQVQTQYILLCRAIKKVTT